jgi:tetratricopeptide (TPR) repeat protein
MLLDFNVAEDVKLECSAAAATLAGTLPYMAPEQLACLLGRYAPPEARGDIYAFGVLLFELLTNSYPFAKAPASSHPEEVDRLLKERQGDPPRLRSINPAVSPALEAIVRRCMEPEPERRYQTARELQEDLECQRTHRPLRHTAEPSRKERLRKWVRRHPRLTSAGLVGVVACTVLAGLAWLLTAREEQRALEKLQEQEIARLRDERDQALAAKQQLDEERKTALLLLHTGNNEPERLDDGIAHALRLLERYEVLDNAAWQQQPLVQALPETEQYQLGAAIGEVLLLLARALRVRQEDAAASKPTLDKALRMNESAAACSPQAAASPALWQQRGELCAMLGREDEARACRTKAADLTPHTAADYYWLASDRLSAGKLREALPLARKATQLEPQNFWAWFVQANSCERLGMEGRAEACYDACIALWPRFHWSYYNRGLTYLRQKEYQLAANDFNEVIRLRPDLTDAYLNRALARQGLHQLAAAEQDLTEALQRGATATRLYFMRARVRETRGDKEGARRDFEEGMRREPTDEKSWLARGFAQLAKNPQAALADFEQALRRNPRSAAGLQNKSHVLAEKLGRHREALDVLVHAVTLYPDSVPARSGRGVLYARLGQRDAALRDAEETLRRDTSPPRLYQVACIYALTSAEQSEDRLHAFRLLSAALRQGYGFDILETDHDLDAIRNLPEFRRLVDAARALRPPRPAPPAKKT